jgi:Na+-driven multidrug efflux pump
LRKTVSNWISGWATVEKSYIVQMAVSAEELGTQDIKNLDKTSGSSIYDSILFMSIILVDTILPAMDCSLGIAAVTVVLPITFLISSLEWPLVSGGSVLSRALGANKKRESTTFANQIMMTSSLASVFALLGIFSAVAIAFC